jgi:hypothetical protein
MSRRRVILAVLACGFVTATYVACAPPAGPRSLRVFEPDRMADLEVDMWQAYYRHENLRLLRGLIATLREQYRYSWARAAITGFHLARAARTFGDTRSDYERVLPDLQRAYEMIREWTGSNFDPAAVSRAELAWWVARRVQGENDPEHVGALIAKEYALLYETSTGAVAGAARLRAEAAALRDAQARSPDWDAIGLLLQRSYRELLAALSVVNV